MASSSSEDIIHPIYKTWQEKFPDGKVNLGELIQNSYWGEVFSKGEFPALIEKLNNDLSAEVLKNNCIYPPPDLLFKALDKSPKDTSVIIVGQEPYHKTITINGIEVPEATGYSFSLPRGAEIKTCLRGILANGLRNKILWKKAATGDISIWSCQGCALLNASLTVRSGAFNSHAKMWRGFTDEVLYHISENMDPGVVVLWGRHALEKMPFLNIERHELIASSHPSVMSVKKTVCCAEEDNNGDIQYIEYPSFSELNQFGDINKALIKKNRLPICWQPV